MGYVIGFDIGSQSTKGLLVDEDCRICGVAQRSYPIQFPHSGWAEQNPQDYLDAIVDITRKLTSGEHVHGSEVTGLGFSVQVDGVIAIGPNSMALSPAIIWLDRRGTTQTKEFLGRLSKEEIFQRSGLQVDASHTAAKMMWLKDELPQAYRGAVTLGSISCFLNSWLTGRLVQDHANSSSSMLYNVVDRAWDSTLIKASLLDPSKLPEIAESTDIAGPLTLIAATSLGLTKNTVVAVSTGDEHAACIGAGAFSNGVVVDIMGTAEPVCSASALPIFDSSGLVETHAHGVPHSFLIENPGFVSGGNSLWLAKSMLGTRDQKLVFELAEKAAPGAGGVIFIPALSGAMTPHWNSDIRGAFTYLSMSTKQEDLARAVVEANAFAFKDVYTRLSQLGLGGQIRCVGGGARSEFLRQIKASICGTDIATIDNKEAGCEGAAQLALVATGYYPDIQSTSKKMLKIDTGIIHPDHALGQRYEEPYQLYREVFNLIEKLPIKSADITEE